MSPMQHLPHELLSKIFSLATHDSDDRCDTLLSPIIITHVCWHWRRIALSTGKLWTTITLTYPTTEAQLLSAITWLGRSGIYPLDILLDFRDPLWNWDEDSHKFRWQHMDVIVHLLLPYVTRWQTFQLLTDTWAPIFAFLYYTHQVKSAPVLQNLAISRCNAYLASKGMSFQPAVLKASFPLFGGSLTNLREVTLAGVHVDWPNSGLRNLLSLELKYHASDVMPSLPQFIDILTASPDLQRLSILGWGPQFHNSSQDAGEYDAEDGEKDMEKCRRTIHLPRLTHFSFGFLDVNYAIKLLSQFTLPALEELSLEDISASLNLMESQDASDVLDYLTIMHCSGCLCPPHSITCYPLCVSVRALHLHSIRATEVSFSCFLHSFSLLQKLSLFDIDSNILVALTPNMPTIDAPEDSLPIIPCRGLTEFECRHMDVHDVLNMARSRAHHGSPFQKVLIHIYEDAVALGSEELAALMDINVCVLRNGQSY